MKRYLWARETGQEILNPSSSKFKALEIGEGEWDEGFKGKKRFSAMAVFVDFHFFVYSSSGLAQA